MAQRKRKGAPPQKANAKVFYYVLGAIAFVGIALIGWTMLKNSQAATKPPEMAAQSPAELVQKAKGVIRGDPNSPAVKIMVFSDYMCPACALYATVTDKAVEREYGTRVTTIYHDFPLINIHPYSFLAARAGRCAEDQQKFWEFHDVLFIKQRDWSFVKTPPIKEFGEYATQVGLARGDFDACLKSDKHSDLVTANLQLGQTVGVGVTPTVYINGRKSASPNDWAVLKAEIDQALGTGPKN